jgi:GT2 family glycosyltransferase
MRLPTVSIIIVSYNGKGLLEQSLPSVLNQSYPKSLYEVIVVDNNSQDDTIPFLKKHFPKVTLIESEENLGFTGGNELGLAKATGEYIVLLNSDVCVDKNWLSSLVSAAKPKNVGIVNSRLRYHIPFLELTLKSDAYPKSQLDGGIDHSPIGVMIENLVCSCDSNSDMVLYKDGFYTKTGTDLLVRRTNGEAKILVPASDLKTAIYKLTLHGLKSSEIDPILIQIFCGPVKLYESRLMPFEVRQVELNINLKKVKPYYTWLIQNAGNLVMRSGYGKDMGSITIRGEDEKIQGYEEESQYFLESRELLSACGASCLIKRKLIDSIGFLDGHYFMYYEDMEYSIRAWRAGWKIRYAPDSIGYHKHRATTGSGETSFFLEHVERNHLAFLLRSFAFQFRDLALAHKYKVRYIGRKAALKYIWNSFPRLVKSRIALAKIWPMNYKELSRYLY